MKHAILFFIILSGSTCLTQNSIDLANIYWRTSPGNTNQTDNLKSNLNMFVADAKLPVVLNDDNILIFGLEYQQNSISIAGNSKVDYFEYKFASTTVQIGFEHKWNSTSKMLFVAMPRLNTDYKNIHTNHFQLGGLALGTTSRSQKFDWKYGLYYNAERFGSMFVPIFGFNWEINDNWRLKTALPINLELSYKATNWCRTGMRFDGVNGSYKLGRSFGNSDTYLDKADNNVWAFTEFNLGKNVWFHLKAGASVLRKYRIYEDSETLNLKMGPINLGDNRQTTNSLFENGWSFEARFIYRLPLK